MFRDRAQYQHAPNMKRILQNLQLISNVFKILVESQRSLKKSRRFLKELQVLKDRPQFQLHVSNMKRILEKILDISSRTFKIFCLKILELNQVQQNQSTN